MKLVTVSEMKSIEAEANRGGLSYEEMMEHAGRGAAEAATNAYSHSGNLAVLGLVGSGNNGGDTLIALEFLARHGWQASAYLVRERPEKEELSDRFKEAGGVVARKADDPDHSRLNRLLSEADLILDGILGTGVQLPLRSDISDVLKSGLEIYRMRSRKPIIVAVDCPSGVDCDTGEADENCLPADLTMCMAAVKVGLLKFPAANLVGEIQVVDIGLDPAMPAWEKVIDRVVDRDMVKGVLPKRPNDAHKGTFGRALLIVGSVNYTGAALLAGKAAYRAGTGLVTLAIPAPLHAPLAGQLPEATWLLLPHSLGVISSEAADVVRSTLNEVSALLIGPGWGQEDTTGQFLSRLLTLEVNHRRSSIGFVQKPDDGNSQPSVHLPPMVVDADAIKLLTKVPNWADRLPANSVLTPHPGEMGVLTGLSTAEIQKDRLEVARRFAQEWGHVVVLKGANTVVADPRGRIFVVPIATPALARAGTGDVLAGIITALLAQGVGACEAAFAGAWLHGMGGLQAERTIGNPASVLAGDVLDGLVAVLGELYTGGSRRTGMPA